MAKKVQENVNVKDELDLEVEKLEADKAEETLSETVASDTLHPGTMPVGPANKSFAIGKIVNAFAGMSPEAINGFWEMINKVGHEADSLPNNKEKNASSVDMKPSDASTANIGANNAFVRKEDFDVDVTKVIAEDLGAMFEGSDLSEETKEKFATLFEAAVNLKASKRIAEIEEAAEVALDEELEEIATNLAESLNSAVDFITEKWLEENAVAIESTLRRDLTDEFLDDIKEVFAKHYVDVPDDKVDVFAEALERIEALELMASEQIDEIEALKAAKAEADAALARVAEEAELNAVAEGLSETDVEKLKTLVEGVSYTDLADFKKKAMIIKENHFKAENTSSINKASVLFEETEVISDEEVDSPKGPMAQYVKMLSHTVRR